MIDKSRFCVVYYDEKYNPAKRKSGTKIALDYALKKKREVINLKNSKLDFVSFINYNERHGLPIIKEI